MSAQNTIQVTAVVRKIISSKVCQVELTNGHQFMAYLKGKTLPVVNENLLGQQLIVKISPVDLSKGLILGLKENP